MRRDPDSMRRRHCRTTRLVRRIGGEVVEMAFVVELAFLKGRGRLSGIPVYSMVVFE